MDSASQQSTLSSAFNDLADRGSQPIFQTASQPSGTFLGDFLELLTSDDIPFDSHVADYFSTVGRDMKGMKRKIDALHDDNDSKLKELEDKVLARQMSMLESKFKLLKDESYEKMKQLEERVAALESLIAKSRSGVKRRRASV